MTQVRIEFNRKKAAERRDAGIKKAISHANAVERGWEDMAYEFFVNVFLKHTHGEFQCEDFRKQCEGVVPNPPHLRAFGGIILKAKHKGLIYSVGAKPVDNPNANRAFSTVWRRSKICNR